MHRMREGGEDMKRRIFKVALFLLLGAIVNVAVAWGIALLFPLDVQLGGTGINDPSQTPRWVVGIHSHMGGTLVFSTACFDRYEYRNLLPSDLPYWSMAHEPPTRYQAAAMVEVTEHAYGWPMVTLFHCKGYPSGVPIPFWPRRGTIARWLPLTVIRPGFAINTVFYAAVLWMLCATIGVVHRRRR